MNNEVFAAVLAINLSTLYDKAAVSKHDLAFDEDVQKSIQAGMDAHLSKPVEPEKLFESLSVLIAKKQQ